MRAHHWYLLLPLLLFPACGGDPAPNLGAGAPRDTRSAAAQPDLSKNEIPPEKLDQVIQAHYEGLGHMERYEYREAAESFRQVHELAPGWIPGSINMAIALLNDTGNQAEEARKASRGGANTGSANFDQALDLLGEVIARDQANLHAHYCRGLILEYIGKLQDAHREFTMIADHDPSDGHVLYHVGATYTDPDDPTQPAGPKDAPKLVEIFSKALERNPYLVPAYYRLQQAEGWAGNRDRQKELIQLFLRMDPDKNVTGTGDPVKNTYGEAGKYATVINPFGRKSQPEATGPPPKFDLAKPIEIALPEGDRWAKADDFTGPFAALGRARARFGAAVAAFDANGDGRVDLYLAAAVKGGMGLRDALLLNQGDHVFTDASASFGLPADQPSLGVAAGDFDADRRVDLFLCGPSGYRLLRNLGQKFEDMTAQAKMDKSSALGLTARWLDLDQDGDLDLYVVNHTEQGSAAEAFGEAPVPKVVNAAFKNVGKPSPIAGRPQDNWAPIAVAPSDLPAKDGLSLEFISWPDGEALVGPPANYTGIASLDADDDRDLDLMLAAGGDPVTIVLNDRLGKFHLATGKPPVPNAPVSGLLVMDLDKDGRSDVIAVSANGAAMAWRNATDASKAPREPAWDAWPLKAKSWSGAQAIDLDMDTWPDLVGLPSRSEAPFLEWARNDGSKGEATPWNHGPNPDGVKRLASFCCVDLVGDPLPDLLVVPDGAAPLLGKNLGNGQHWLALDLTGQWKVNPQHMRTNPHGLGTRVTIEGQGLRVTYDHATTSAGLGQSVAPVVLGLGGSPSAELVRLRWPDGTMQCELNTNADVKLAIVEHNRKTGSCPVLFTWNGERFVCMGDFLGGGGLGYLVAPGVHGQPDRDESVAISGEQLKAVDGVFRVSITEPMDEVAYLDRVRLVVVDRPPGVSATPDERFAPEGPRPTGEVIAWKESFAPVKAADLKGEDLTRKLQDWDRDTADSFKKLTGWIGYAEEHGIVLDFGDKLSRFGPEDPLVLALAGWVEYPYSQTNYAAATAGVALQPPSVERLNAAGEWEVIEPHAGYPAGMPRMTTLDLTGKLNGPRCVIRLRTNMECYYDQAFIALRDPAAERALRTTALPPARAVLGHRGYTREASPDGRPPLLYDYDYVDPAPLAIMSGQLTRHGDVLPLLLADDDHLCLIGPGDEARVEFDAGTLPSLPDGWTRSYVLKSEGYCKDADPFTAASDAVGPLPWRAMPSFPFAGPVQRPADPAYEAYLKEYQTRPAGGR